MFPAGYPRFAPDSLTRNARDWCIVDTIRFAVTELNAFSARKTNVTREALEYTFIYEHASNSTSNLIAHGYVLAFGEIVLFVQHTSGRAITSDLANAMAQGLILARPSE
jgi:hypothetical protein